MSLEEKLRAYAAKGELVHLSLVYSGDGYDVRYAAATPAAGYSIGRSADPVEAIEKALAASPARPARVSKPKADTVTVIADPGPIGEPEIRDPETGLSRSEWTTP